MRPGRLLALSIVAACGGEGASDDAPDAPPPDPCELTAVVPGGTCELGLGYMFSPLAADQDVTFELGSQGLWMFIVNARVPEGAAGRVGELVGVTAAAKLEATGEATSLAVSCRPRVLAPAGAGYLQLESPYLLPMQPDLTPKIDNARITLTLDVRDASGNVARDVRTVITHLPAAH